MPYNPEKVPYGGLVKNTLSLISWLLIDHKSKVPISSLWVAGHVDHRRHAFWRVRSAGAPNDAPARFGPPKFDDAKFQFESPALTVTVK